ncbi:MAG TPA: response regulator transcription factor [Solirubrobacter sp.]|nr:response regulator transcription factor [Solirubrobacter sp.]
MIGVVIADDQALVRGGFRMILDVHDDIRVLAEAGDGREALDAARLHHPDVVLMDVRMPGLDGIEATRRLLADPAASARVLMLTTFDLDEHVYDALKAGASGFMLKNSPPERLVDAVRAIARGDALLGPNITRRLIEHYVNGPRTSREPPDRLADLTERELEVLRLVARGLTNAEIAERLVIGEGTVKTHVSRILAKLRLRDRVQAVVLAYESGLILPGRALE